MLMDRAKYENLFRKYSEAGDFADIYTQGWFERVAGNLTEMPAKWEKRWRQLKKTGEGRLVALRIHDGWRSEKEEFERLFPGILSDERHNPDVMFLNFNSGAILAVGLGRKNRIFFLDGEGQYIENAESAIKPFSSDDELDIVKRMISTLERYGWAIYDMASDDYHKEDLVEMLENGPREDGLFRLEDGEAGLDEASLDAMLHKHEEYEEEIAEALEFFQIVFPGKAEKWELNTGDL